MKIHPPPYCKGERKVIAIRPTNDPDRFECVFGSYGQSVILHRLILSHLDADWKIHEAV